MARFWHAPPEDTVELFLAAQRLGIMVMGWDLLCPRCRGAKARAERLHELPQGAHCSSCNIDYGRDFTRNVELTFHPGVVRFHVTLARHPEELREVFLIHGVELGALMLRPEKRDPVRGVEPIIGRAGTQERDRGFQGGVRLSARHGGHVMHGRAP
jgi:Family of unknown function (DUF5939)